MMCDTFVLLPTFTNDNKFYFAKNSDREPNEAHEVVIIPEKSYQSNEQLKCTYISIPQVEKTNRMILCKPVWIWGAEMGVNEHGVVIGNEAVFSKVPAKKVPGLIGMDYLRLGLERGNSAAEALDVITNLLEVYGQSGNCGFNHPFYYHNSFIIADQNEAWKLETVDKEWIVEKIDGFGAISNGYSIESGDRFSKNLIGFAEEKNWIKKGQSFNFRDAYSDWLYTTFSDSKQRRSCSIKRVNQTGRNTQLIDVFSILRTHREGSYFRPDKGLAGADLCMHAGFGPIRGSQTTGSMVIEQHDDELIVWVTGSSAPCLSIFKPMILDQAENYFGIKPALTYDSESYWWQQEIIHRKIIMDYPELSKDYKENRDQLERNFIEEMANTKDKLRSIQKNFSEANDFQSKWIEILNQEENNFKTNFLYSLFWKNNNNVAKIPVE